METIVIIGAGNVANHLAINLHKSGLKILQILNRNLASAKLLAEKVDAEPSSGYAKINQEADLYILALSDDAIATVALKLAAHLPKKAFVVHTSGATASTVLKEAFKNYGVFYPLQTFSKENLETLRFEEVPICVDAVKVSLEHKLYRLAEKLSQKVYKINDEDRAKLHVAAVFANNFSNRMFSIAEDLLKQEGLDFEILKPLIFETVNKLVGNSAHEMQTGPARRDDQETISRHQKYLDKIPSEYGALYELITKSINAAYKTND